MDFMAVTDRMGALGVTQAEMAEALGVAASTVRAARLDPASSNYRHPPDRWRPKLLRLARERGGALQGLAEELEDA